LNITEKNVDCEGGRKGGLKLVLVNGDLDKEGSEEEGVGSHFIGRIRDKAVPEFGCTKIGEYSKCGFAFTN